MNQTRVPIPKPEEILSPKLDVCFKMLFGNERNKAILISFLKSILDEAEDEIEELTLLNPLTDKEYRGDKQGILDIKARLKSGAVVGIEIQILNTREMAERVIFYLSKIYSQQASAGNPYGELKKAICIVLTDFNLIPDSDVYYNRFWFINPNNGIRFSDILEIHTLEIPKIPKESDDSLRYKWMKFISASGKEEMEMLAKYEDAIKLAYEELQKISFDDAKRELYEARLKNLLDEESRLRSAEYDGIEKGMAEGLAKGKAEGRAEGKREIACNLLDLGLVLEDIAKVTELSISEVEAINYSRKKLTRCQSPGRHP